jgi:hypothetical protein
VSSVPRDRSTTFLRLPSSKQRTSLETTIERRPIAGERSAAGRDQDRELPLEASSRLTAGGELPEVIAHIFEQPAALCPGQPLVRLEVEAVTVGVGEPGPSREEARRCRSASLR